MLEDARAISPLPSADIHKLLQGIFTDSQAPTELAIEAFAVTAASLYGWCRPSDIEHAMSRLAPMPDPRCLHGSHWKLCQQCAQARDIAIA